MCLSCGIDTPGEMLCNKCRVSRNFDNKQTGRFMDEFYLGYKTVDFLFHKYDDGIGISDFILRDMVKLGIDRIVFILDSIEKIKYETTVKYYLKHGEIYIDETDYDIPDRQYILRPKHFTQTRLTIKEFNEYMKMLGFVNKMILKH